MEAFMLVMDMICMILLLFCVVRAGRKDAVRSLGLFAYKEPPADPAAVPGNDASVKEKKNA